MDDTELRRGSKSSEFSSFSRSPSLDIHMEGEGLLQLALEERLSRHENLPDANEGGIAKDTSEQIIGNIGRQRKPVDLTPYLTTPNDSNDPSYTNLVLPYYAVCRQRYHRAQKMMQDQFKKEVTEHEAFQKDGLDGIRIHRQFCKAVIRYPKAWEVIRLSPQQERRLEAIMQREDY